MSDYIKQNESIMSFNNNTPWTILSSIEKAIKTKIEAVGIPLRDWNISINYGIKTGYNEAFIINSNKRQEILDNCLTEEERERTDEIIRPILRGKDIKRYGVEWKKLYLINFHNGIPKNNIPPLDIVDFPSLKKHFDYYYSKLVIRDDKGYTPYNLRSCAYLEDFNKQKIIYPNMTKYMPFVYDDKGFFVNQKCFIITGENISFLTLFLNSSLFKYCFRESFPELLGGTRELSKVFFEKIPVKKITDTNYIKNLLKDIQDNFSLQKAQEIDEFIFSVYDLSEEERKVIICNKIK